MFFYFGNQSIEQGGAVAGAIARWQRQALAKAVPSSAERDDIKRLRAGLKRVKQERGILGKVVAIFA